MLALALAVVAWFRSADDDVVARKRATGAEIAKAFVIAIPALILPFLIRAAVVEGVATAVEVSTIGIAYTIVVGPLRLPPVRLAARLADAGRHRVALGRDPVHRRHRDRDGLGADAVRLLARACDR